MAKQSVFIVGGTGRTGEPITLALLDDPKFDVHVAVRESSLSKEIVKDFKAKGATIHTVDTDNASARELAELFKGIDTVISCLLTFPMTKQKVLVDACKLAGVKRFIPSEWATAYKRGVLGPISEQKAEVQDHIKEVGVPYTLIDVGWWMHPLLPALKTEHLEGIMALAAEYATTIVGTGNVKSAITHLPDIGKFVARIIADPRTLNRYVFIWNQELTQNEIIETAKRISGREFVIKHKSAEDLAREDETAPPDEHMFLKIARNYFKSMWIDGDNTVANAKKIEYGRALDAQELYPDVKVTTLEELAKGYYAK